MSKEELIRAVWDGRVVGRCTHQPGERRSAGHRRYRRGAAVHSHDDAPWIPFRGRRPRRSRHQPDAHCPAECAGYVRASAERQILPDSGPRPSGRCDSRSRCTVGQDRELVESHRIRLAESGVVTSLQPTHAQCTLVRYDERGIGLSDRDVPDFSFEAFVDDLETVVDEYDFNVSRCWVSHKGRRSRSSTPFDTPNVCRDSSCGGFAKGWRKRGNAADVARAEASVTLIREGWGQDNPAARQMFTSLIVPDATHEEMQWFNELERISASAETAIRLLRVLGDIDVTELLPRVEVPTLVLHSRGDARVSFEHGLTLAHGIPKARLVALE